MKFVPLIWAGLWRNRLRTIFTLISIFVALALFGLLQGVDTALHEAAGWGHLDRLVVNSRTVGSLPFAELDQIERINGVEAVADYTWTNMYYQDVVNSVSVIAVNPRRAFSVYGELRIASDQLDAFSHTRAAAVVGRRLARKFGWKVGDRITLQSPTPKEDGTWHWPLDIVGIFDDPELGDLDNFTNCLLIDYEYYDDSRAVEKGMVSGFIVSLKDSAQSSAIAAAIDQRFANSFDETMSESEKETRQASLKQLGDVNIFMDAVIGAVFLTLLFVVGNTMMQSMRERIPEFAILKAIGFSNTRIFALILTETLMLCMIGTAFGLAAAGLFYPELGRSHNFQADLSWIVILEGLGAAGFVAFCAGFPPAWRTARLSVINALAGR